MFCCCWSSDDVDKNQYTNIKNPNTSANKNTYVGSTNNKTTSAPQTNTYTRPPRHPASATPPVYSNSISNSTKRKPSVQQSSTTNKSQLVNDTYYQLHFFNADDCDSKKRHHSHNNHTSHYGHNNDTSHNTSYGHSGYN